jgi:AcrR family transcriptional regulator
MSKDSKQIIIEQAYALFLQKGYKAVTMQDILQATELSKGAIYHYFKSKEEIFESAVRFFFTGGISRDFESFPNNSLKEFIDHELKYIVDKREYLIAYSKEQSQSLSSNYFSVIFEAAQILPSFKADLDSFRLRELKSLEIVIKNAIVSGEIHSEMKPNQLARLFIYVNKGLGMQLIMDNNFPLIHKELRIMWMEIYKGLTKK